MSDFSGIPRARLPIAVAMIALLALLLSWLQGRFNSSDVKKAIGIALQFKPAAAGPSVFDAMLARKQGDPRCDGEIVSQLLGDVRVVCSMPGAPAVQYEFRVLLDGKRPPRAVGRPAEELLAGLSSH